MAGLALGGYWLWPALTGGADFSGNSDQEPARVYRAFAAVPVPVDPSPSPRIKLQIAKAPDQSIAYALTDMNNVTVMARIEFSPGWFGGTRIKGTLEYAGVTPLNSPDPGPPEELAAKFQAMVDEVETAIEEGRKPGPEAQHGLRALAIPSDAWKNS